VFLASCSGRLPNCRDDYSSFRPDAGDGSPYLANPETGITDSECEKACEVGPCVMNAINDKDFEILCKRPVVTCGI